MCPYCLTDKNPLALVPFTVCQKCYDAAMVGLNGGLTIKLPTAIDFIPIHITIQDIMIPECECGTDNPLGQGHSGWCKLYKREF